LNLALEEPVAAIAFARADALAMPKSINLATPPTLSKIFCGDTSR